MTNKYLVGIFLFFSFTLFFSYQLSYSSSHEDLLEIDKSFYSLLIKDSGNLSIRVNDDEYTLVSSFSYPGEKINWFPFDSETTTNLNLEIHELEDRVILSSENKFYLYERVILLGDRTLNIKDSFFNKTKEAVGVISINEIGYGSFNDSVYISGLSLEGTFFNTLKRIAKSTLEILGLYKVLELYSPSNQSILVSQDSSYIALLIEDVVSRSKTYLKNSYLKRSTTLENRNTSIEPSGNIVFEKTIFLSKTKGSYFDFVNRVRSERQLNSVIEGPFNFFHIIENKALLDNKSLLANYLNLLDLNLIVLTPWLDYDNFNESSNDFITRGQYLDLFSYALRKIKDVNPDIEVLGAVQSNVVSLPESLQKEILSYEKISHEGFSFLSKRGSNAVLNSDIGWKNDLVLSEDGRVSVEYCLYGKEGNIPELNISVEPSSGSYQEQFIYNQIDFLVNTVNLDGIYLDQFNQTDVSDYQRYSYDRNDNLSVDINSSTGAIIRHYNDMALTTLDFQKDIINFTLENDIRLVANTFPVSLELHDKRIMRFGEGFWSMISSKFLDSEVQPLPAYDLAKGHFSSPIALSTPEWLETGSNLPRSEVIYRNIIFNLQQGNLLYLAQAGPSFIVEGERSLPYEVLKNIFPIEVINLGRGWLEGNGKYLTTVSKKVIWNSKIFPKVLYFNYRGERVQDNFKYTITESGFEIYIDIKDWNELVILTSKDSS